MVEYDLDDLGVPAKTENKPRDGIKKGDKILHKFNEEYNPVLEYKERLKKESPTAFASFNKDYEWLKSHLDSIVKFAHNEFEIDEINMSTYFITLNAEDHNCMQIEFPHENTILNSHYNGPNFAYYFTSTVNNNVKNYNQIDLARSYLRELWESIPNHQLENINWIAPKFLSDYAYDADPHLTVEMEFDLDGIQQDGGIYSDLFVQEKRKFPFFPFQPFFGGKKGDETGVIILPKDELFDIGDFRKKIANRLNIDDSNRMRLDKRYDFKINIEDIMNLSDYRTIKNIRIKHANSTEMLGELTRDIVQMSEQVLRGAQQCTASDYVKGKDDEAIEKGLIKRFIDSYENPTIGNLESTIFGPAQGRRPFDGDLVLKMNKEFQEYKKNRVGE